MNELTDDEQFFYDHAGWSYNPETETPEQGRARTARALAEAEASAKANGCWAQWEHDSDPFSDDVHGPDEYGYVCVLYAPMPFSGTPTAVAAVGAVDAEEGDPYRRVIVAELSRESLAE